MAQDKALEEAKSSTEWSSFISAWQEAGPESSTYSDFFQETSDGNISIGPKAQKSGLEIVTTILGYVLPVIIVITLFWLFHVFIRGGGGAKEIKDKYTFLCPYLTYGVSGLEESENCESMKTIEDSYTKRSSDLEVAIINKLAEYIPIKITKNLLITSPERAFVIDTYKNKIRMDRIMEQFQEVLRGARSSVWENIICNGISITGDGQLTTQCSIYGGLSWSDDENGRLGSSRVEALKFAEVISDTSKSKFILLNPPSSLSMEEVSSEVSPIFKSRSSLSLQLQYVPFNEKL
jgi:hypothetical protein